MNQENETTQYGEVQFFFRAKLGNEIKACALVSVYGPPDEDLLHESSHALWLCHYNGNETLKVIDIKQIATCVAMIPFTDPPDGRFFVCEKMGLQVSLFTGTEEDPWDPSDPDA